VRLSDKLKQQRHDLLERMKAMSDRAGDRALEGDEAVAWELRCPR
jgi:hypothetical protein